MPKPSGQTKRSRQIELLENLIRIARAEASLPPNRDIAHVRASLERELGGTVSQRQAAEVLKVSQPGLRRWIESGDIPLVVRQDGAKAVPVSEVIRLAHELEQKRASSEHERFPLEAVMADRRRDAEALRRHIHAVVIPIDEEASKYQSKFAWLYNAAVVLKLNKDLTKSAKQRLWRLQEGGHIHDHYVELWEVLLDRPIDEIANELLSITSDGADLRQNSPFDGVLTHHERQLVFEDFRLRK